MQPTIVNNMWWMFNFLSFVPLSLVYGVAGAALAGILASALLSKIPFIGTYRFIINIVSTIVLILSLWLAGYLTNDAVWQARAEEFKQKIEQAEKESKEKNVEIQTKVVTKLQVIKERQEGIIQYIDREVKVYDDQCKIPKEFIDALNKAAEPVK